MSRLRQLLLHELAGLDQLQHVLEKENQALAAGSTELLPPISEQKIACMKALEALEEQRRQFVGASASDKSARETMAAWLRGQPDKDAETLWQSVIEKSLAARHLHEVNGQLIVLQLGKTREALDILTHRQTDDSLYGSDGQSASGSGKRISDSA